MFLFLYASFEVPESQVNFSLNLSFERIISIQFNLASASRMESTTTFQMPTPADRKASIASVSPPKSLTISIPSDDEFNRDDAPMSPLAPVSQTFSAFDNFHTEAEDCASEVSR
jgi:hypothetical protein